MPTVNALIDSGPLVALFDADDKYHAAAKAALAGFTGRLITTWAVLTEVSYLLSFSGEVQLDFLKWLARGALVIENLDERDFAFLIERMKKYNDRPMDLADATLMCVAEKSNLKHVFSVDSDFSIYKTSKGKMLINLFGKDF
jgi:uncharacterized protein